MFLTVQLQCGCVCHTYILLAVIPVLWMEQIGAYGTSILMLEVFSRICPSQCPVPPVSLTSNEPGELLQWHCRDDSTINIGISIIIILTTIINIIIIIIMPTAL